MDNKEPEIILLSNGIRLVYLKRKAFVSHLGIMMFAGSRFERNNEMGLAHFLEHCLFKGTTNRSSLKIFSDLDNVGGELNAYTNKEELCVHASFRNEHFKIASDLLSDVVFNANFPKEEIRKEKEVVIDEINSYLDTPSERIFDEFEEHVFQNHALGWNVLGTKKSLKSFDSKVLSDYKTRLFNTHNMVLSFVGDLELNEVLDVIHHDFGDVQTKAEVLNYEDVEEFNSFDLIEKKSNYQTHYMLGGRAPSYTSDHRRSMALLMNVLGGPALNSRLSLSIREEHGYAYNVEAGYSSYSDTGIWNIYLGTDKKYLKKAKDLVWKELDILCNDGFKNDELTLAKEQIKGHIALSCDNGIDIMLNNAKNLLIYGKIDSVSSIYEQIDQISQDEIQRVAKDHFSKDSIGELTFLT